MKREPVWLPVQAVIDLHAEQIAQHGGLPGLRDRGGLEAALARPRQIHSYGGQAVSLPSLAAAYAWGLSRNHPFADGNKRMTLLAVYVFLGLNGMHLDAREEEAYRVIMQLADGALSEPELARWIEQNSLEHKDA